MRDLETWPTCPKCEDAHTYRLISTNYQKGSRDALWFLDVSAEYHTQCEEPCWCARYGHRPRRYRNALDINLSGRYSRGISNRATPRGSETSEVPGF